MGADTAATFMSVAAVATTLMVLLAGINQLGRQSGERIRKIYLGVVLAATAAVLGAALTLYSGWESPGGLGDEQEVVAALYLGIPFACAFLVLIGGSLLGLLGPVASRERAAPAPGRD